MSKPRFYVLSNNNKFILFQKIVISRTWLNYAMSGENVVFYAYSAFH